MKQTKLGSFSLLLALLIFGACDGLNPNKIDNDPEDLKDPILTLVHPPMVEPGLSGKAYQENDTVTVKVKVEDNWLLGTWQIDMSYRGDVEYLKTAADPMAKTFVGWLSGDEDSIVHTILLDNDPWAGPYDIVVTVKDSAGNTSTLTTFIQVTNTKETIKPTILATSPTSSMVDTFGIGFYIPVQAQISDNNNALSDMFVRVRNSFSYEVLDSSERWIELPGPAYNLDESIYIPPVTPGDYQVEIFVHDSTKNLQSKIIPIYITTF